MSQTHPARIASEKSREYVHTHNKEGWLGLFAPEGIIEDPIGISYLDPIGKGHSTPAQREAFWDQNIAKSNINIAIHESFAAGSECANRVTLDIVNEMDGKKVHSRIQGVFTYKVNDAGKLLALRGYWGPENVEQVA